LYTIAYRVLTAQDIWDALSYVANAIEIDMGAWKGWKLGWKEDHEGTPNSAGNPARPMFETIAGEHKVGK
jgi:hypothetical protein